MFINVHMLTFDALRPFYVFLPAFIKVLFFLLIVLLICNRKVIWNSFKEINKKTWLLLFLIILMALLLRFFWVPHGHTVFYDSYHVAASALTIQEDGIYAFCMFMSEEYCHEHSHPVWPPAFSVLVSIVFDVLGSPDFPELIAFRVNALLGTVSVFLVFLLSYLWTKKEDIALISAFSFSMLPLFLRFSGGASLEIFSVFFVILTLIFFEIFIKERGKGMFWLFLTSLLCTVYIRAENIFLVPIFLLFFVLIGDIKRFLEKKNRAFFIISFLCFILFLIPAIFFIYLVKNMLAPQGWNPTIMETAGYFLENSKVNFYFFLQSSFNPFLLVFLGIMGVIFTFLKERRAFLSFAFFFFFYFVFYSSYEAGGFGRFGGDFGDFGCSVRFSSILYVPLLYFLNKGIFYLLDRAGVGFKKIALLVFLLVLAVNLTLTLPHIIPAKHSLTIISDLLVSSRDKIPEDAYFVSDHAMVIRSTINRKVVEWHIFESKNEYFKDKKIFLLKDLPWYNPDREDFRTFIHENYNLQPIETVLQHNYEYGVYALIKK